jgi:glycosyltransferase involved in cell wall biosynthesis
MARGVPALYVGPQSDAQYLIEESGGGACVANGDVAGLGNLLRRLANDQGTLSKMSRSAEQFYRDRLAQQIGLEQYRTVFEEVGDCARV